MLEYFITFRSVTRAQQAVAALRRSGIYALMDRIPLELSSGGCGYGVYVREADYALASSILRQERILFERIFRFGRDRQAREVFA